MTPEKQGQVCKMLKPLPEENPLEVYLVTKDIEDYADNDIIYVVSLTDLQRNIANPLLSPRTAVKKSDLSVVAEDLKGFVESWNK